MQWKLLSQQTPNSADELLDILLKNRGLTTKKQQESFLHPVSPLQLSAKDVGVDEKQLKKAVSLLNEAKEKKWKVIVFGDYDCDGICATTVLWETLYEYGIRAMPFIPSRDKHGYGLSNKALDDILAEEKPDLLVTVDNGIVAHEPFARLKTVGVRTILTDHHQLDAAGAPLADAVIHTTKLCGTTVAWILVRAVNEAKAALLLDLCAIATIADQVPLLDANRSFASHGLSALRKTKRPGLLTLLQHAGIQKEAVGTYEVNYAIAPRINAMGRIGDPKDALRLLCSRSINTAQKYAQQLNSINLDRQQMTVDMIDIAREKKGEWSDQHLIVSDSDQFHEGVIGLIAGKLMEEFSKPAIVIARGEKVAKGSARSVVGVNITEFLREFKHLLLDVGGHPMAAGFSLLNEHIGEFAEKIREYAKKHIDPSLLVRQIEVDVVLTPSLAVLDTVEVLSQLEPHGSANPRPVFLMKEMMFEKSQVIGREQRHLKCTFVGDGKRIEVMWFGGAEKKPLEMGKSYDLVVRMQENSWNGRKSVQLIITSLKMSDKEPSQEQAL